ncbi:DNA polymerase III subunit gamma/tau [Luteibaculum oceani]|uniref:DNA polymerase III subunit gamma/tau n=1 Tax=Luteibaculum oceani TaxID=1294296 RepID=A0A5C6VDH1_9FLAO|nr:DNA polymerase III subunit gamma/tau [Luteibaculum oceani]TXC81715.1 DNA polymerase III subunit gamma/tau [Luteibaculum oceani]
MSDQFIVSARKYRPATFESVVGQSAVTDTLKNAIKNNKLAQAFLFCGPRGVGKTTCARILAKAVNAENPDQLEDIADDQMNIFELDAASNNSVDDIRNLIEQVRIAPAGGKKFKVYIIDEVHMLSASAFNAFLKTLEEPPSYAIFVLATTEKHKILPTILSRCQVFDFQRIKVQDITDHLEQIAQKEGIKAEREALHIIATKADGGLRDALSIFDQMVAFGGKEITYELVIENLNLLDYEYYFKITDGLNGGDLPSVLNLFNDVLSKGFDGHNFIVGLADHFRNLLVGLDPKTIDLIIAGDDLKGRYAKQAQESGTNKLVKWLKLCNKADNNYKASKHPRLLVELALIEMLESEMEELKKKVASPN